MMPNGINEIYLFFAKKTNIYTQNVLQDHKQITLKFNKIHHFRVLKHFKYKYFQPKLTS